MGAKISRSAKSTKKSASEADTQDSEKIRRIEAYNKMVWGSKEMSKYTGADNESDLLSFKEVVFIAIIIFLSALNIFNYLNLLNHYR